VTADPTWARDVHDDLGPVLGAWVRRAVGRRATDAPATPRTATADDLVRAWEWLDTVDGRLTPARPATAPAHTRASNDRDTGRHARARTPRRGEGVSESQPGTPSGAPPTLRSRARRPEKFRTPTRGGHRD